MSKNNNIALMYQKELNDLKENIIDSIKFVALENKLGRIKFGKDKFPTNNSSGLEVVYNNSDGKRVVKDIVIIESNKIKYLVDIYEVKELLNLLQILEEKDYSILA